MHTEQKKQDRDLLADLQLSQDLAEELVNVLKEENKALRAMKIQSLTRITKEKSGLLLKINYLDEQISQTIKDSCERLNGSAGGRKIADLCLHLPNEQASVLKQFNQNLRELRQKIETQNLINKQFTGRSLQVINEAISLITAQPKQHRTYGNRGTANSAHKAPVMISREV